MSLFSSTASASRALSRDVLDRLADPLRGQIASEDLPLLDLLVTLAASACNDDGLDAVAASATRDPAPTLAALLGATRWEDLRITVIDGHTVRIGCGKRAVRRTYIELGLFAAGSRDPTRKWAMLLALCAGHGTLPWRAFGDFRAVRQAVSVLRAKLRAAIGIEGDPFQPFTFERGWRARFFASSVIGED